MLGRTCWRHGRMTWQQKWLLCRRRSRLWPFNSRVKGHPRHRLHLFRPGHMDSMALSLGQCLHFSSLGSLAQVCSVVMSLDKEDRGEDSSQVVVGDGHLDFPFCVVERATISPHVLLPGMLSWYSSVWCLLCREAAVPSRTRETDNCLWWLGAMQVPGGTVMAILMQDIFKPQWKI